jgi:hypothetical protein
MTDTNTQLLEALASRLGSKLRDIPPHALRAFASRLQATDPDLARIADQIANLIADIDARERGDRLDPRPSEPVRLTMASQLTLITDTGHLDGRITGIWIGDVNVTDAVTTDGLHLTGDTNGTRMIAEVTITLVGPITATTPEALA